MKKKYSLIVIDSTGELTVATAHHRRKYGRVLLVNPMGLFPKELGDLPHVGFNPLSPKWIKPEDPFTFLIRCQKVGNGVVRREPGSRETYWADSSRELTTAAIMAECKLSKSPTLATVATNLRGNITSQAARLMSMGDPQLFDAFARWGRPGAEDIKSLNEVQENVRTELWPFTLPPIADCLSRDEIDFRWCVHEPITIYILLPMELIKELGRFLRLAASHATAQIMSEQGSGSVRCMLMIDELFQIGHIDDLDANLAANRKYGLDLCLCLNDMEQLQKLNPQTANSVLNNCGVRQWVDARDEVTSEHLSKLCGEREVVTMGRNVSSNPIFDYENPTQPAIDKLGVSDTKNVNTRRLILPHEVRGLGPKEQILWLPGVENPIRCNREPYFEIPELARRARKNPFYREGD